MSGSARWSIVALVVLIALGVALWTELGAQDSGRSALSPQQDTVAARDRRDADTAEALAGPRAAADLEPCPGPVQAPGPVPKRCGASRSNAPATVRGSTSPRCWPAGPSC